MLEGCLGEPDIGSRRHDSTGQGHRIDQPVFTEKRVYTHTGPLGFQVTLGRCITNWPDPVDPTGTMEQSVFPSPKADQEGCISTDSVHPGVMMFSTQPGADVSAGPNRTRRSVGAEDRQGVGGPVGRFPYSDIRQTDDRSLLNDVRRDDVVGRQSVYYVPFTNVPRATEHPDDRPGEVDYDSTTQTGGESGGLTGVWDPLIQKDNGFQIVRVNASLDNCLTNSRDVGRSSDSGVHSWTEQWANMSDNSMDGSYDDTGDLHRNMSDEMSRLMFGAPPNTEDEGDSDYPGTDGSLTEMLDSCPSEAMSDRDRDMTCSEMTDSDNDRTSDIAALSDFSDDSSILGIRKVLRRRVPYRGRAPLPMKLFDEEMEKSDLVFDRFPDRHVHKFVDRPAVRPPPTGVGGTYTPPIHRKRGRKYAVLKACESDMEDYFATAEEERRWFARAVAWYQPCV